MYISVIRNKPATMESDSECSEDIEMPLRFPEVPEAIIPEILSRLPVKNLLEFKCVSKAWNSLISSKFFIKTHLQNSTKNPTFSHHRFISTISRSFWKLEHYSLPYLWRKKDIYSSYLDGERDKQKALDFVGSCNGLICILIDEISFVLWNPATKESRILPDFHGGKNDAIQIYNSKYGFGFDESSDDYKVFAVMFVTKPGNKRGSKHQATVAKAYSLKSDSWKRIELLEDDSPLDLAGKFASGRLHWTRNSDQNSRWNIVSFDLKTEAFGHVDQPSHVEPGFYPTLGAHHGRLCVLCDYCKTQLDVWIWNQYGNQDSWTKMVSISLSDHPEGTLSNPLCILPNSEVLFLDHESTFISYNPKTSSFYYPPLLDPDEQSLGVGAEVYVQSLVSVVSENATKSPVEVGTSKNGTSKKGKPRKNLRSKKKK